MAASAMIIEDADRIREIAAAARRVAVLGCRSEKHADRPAFFVPSYLHQMGVTVYPVVCVPQDVGTTILGETARAKVADVPDGPVDVVCVFRKPSDLPDHVPDILEAKPKAVWLQSGIRNPEVEAQLAEAGIQVVADRCLMVEHRQAVGMRGGKL